MTHTTQTDRVQSFTVNYNLWRDACYEVAKSKGWWDDPRKHDEVQMLIVTEIAEAAEGYREQNHENLIEELADVVIRAVDWAGSLGMDVNVAVRDYREMLGPAVASYYRSRPTLGQMRMLANIVSMTIERSYERDPVTFRRIVGAAVFGAEEIARLHGVELDGFWKAVEKKHEKNKTRTYRHGGKVA